MGGTKRRRVAAVLAIVCGTAALPLRAQEERPAGDPAPVESVSVVVPADSVPAPSAVPVASAPVASVSVVAPTAPPAASANPVATTALPPRPTSTAESLAKFGIVAGSLVTFVGLYLVFDAQARTGQLDIDCVSHKCPPSAADRIAVAKRETDIGLYTLLGGVVMLGSGIAIYTWAIPKKGADVSLLPGGLSGRF
jgi:hypothetical protein